VRKSRDGGGDEQPRSSASDWRRSRVDSVVELGTSFDGGLVRPRGMWSKFQMPRFSCQVSGSAPALGRCRVRLAPDLSKKPPACGRIFFQLSPRGRVLVHPRRARSPRPPALPRHWRGWDDRPRSSASDWRRSRVDSVVELGTSFDGGLVRPRVMWLKFRLTHFSCWTGSFDFPARRRKFFSVKVADDFF